MENYYSVCSLQNDLSENGGGDINPGDTVHENDELFFTATLSTGQTVDKWTVNDVDQGGQSSPSFHYKVKTADAPSGSIKVDCAIKPWRMEPYSLLPPK